MSHAYPMMLDLTGRTVVIIGGGKVAARKARGLLEAGAVVRCVAPEFCDLLPPAVQQVREAYHSAHLDGATIVFAATDRPEVNEAVLRDAHARKLLASRADADAQGPGDFITPAVHRIGSVVVAVSAGSPALSALVRNHLAEACDPRWRQMADLMLDLRPSIKSTGLDVDNRRRILRELATDEALDILAEGGPAAVRQWLVTRHPELDHV